MGKVVTIVSVFVVIVCMHWTGKATAVKLLFSESGGEITIKNCSNCLFSIECNEITCQCVTLTSEEVSQLASADRNVTWWYSEELEICCNSLTSPTAQQTLADLLDYAYLPQLGLKQCHTLATADKSQWLTIFGLRELYMTAARDSTFTSKTFDLRAEDEDLSDLSQEYRDHHIAFLARNTVDGELNMRSWSIVDEVGNANTAQMVETAVARSPDVIRAKADGRFMWTPIYGV